jgi:hypothetical protein
MSLKRFISARSSLFVAGLVLAAPAFVYGASASGQAQPAVAPPSSHQSVDDAAHRGLVVHGQWKIRVKNADGTTASTTEFENSLVDSGYVLEHLMLGSIVTGTWGIAVAPNSGGTSPCNTATCLIVTSTSSGPGSGLCSAIQAAQTTTCFGGLAYLMTSTPAFQLSGQFAASQAGTITSVSTYISFCATDTTNIKAPSTISPSTCASGSNQYGAGGFTSATATSTPAFSPVSVTSGQTVQITVVISLS